MMASNFIDRKEFIKKFCGEQCGCTREECGYEYVEDGHDACFIIEEIEKAPAVDAVEVVRCKDCVCVSVCNDELVCERISDVMDGYYHGTVDVVKPDDYCSYGVRKRAVRCG